MFSPAPSPLLLTFSLPPTLVHSTPWRDTSFFHFSAASYKKPSLTIGWAYSPSLLLLTGSLFSSLTETLSVPHRSKIYSFLLSGDIARVVFSAWNSLPPNTCFVFQLTHVPPSRKLWLLNQVFKLQSFLCFPISP